MSACHPQTCSGGQSLSLLTRGLCRPQGGAERCACSLETDALPCTAPESVREARRTPRAHTALPLWRLHCCPGKGSTWNCLVGSGPSRGAVVKYLPANAEDARDTGSIPRWGRSPGEGNDSPPQFSCLENPTVGGGWRATVHGVSESDTTEQLSTRSGKIIKIFDIGKHRFPQKLPKHFTGEGRDRDAWFQLRK